ncbi:DUF2484 family protein [Litoreibacter roseus]|uniref:DUF2484 family protein n=1 Tax=Litoreibacter roseus TaxID=2601869 RepID=A0A6N6JC25_9RHOB|nr:DUF2484 family protein [Litoreibacter roseus]GFE63557.1 hypothetical protein KIN_06310 [Litoreibacter roseus]
MTTSLIFALIWLVMANVLAMLPSRDNHWQRAYVLIALGVPLLGWVTLQNGPWVGLLCMAAGISVLRWPVRYFGRWIGRKLSKPTSTNPAE